MKPIYTSYYSRAKQFPADKHVLCQISNSSPKIDIVKLDILIPDWNTIVWPMKIGAITEEGYKLRYFKQLDKNKEEIKNLIDFIISDEKFFVFLCYEAPGKFCHRHLLADWINNMYEEVLVLEKE